MPSLHVRGPARRNRPFALVPTQHGQYGSWFVRSMTGMALRPTSRSTHVAEADLSELGGLTGWVASVIQSLGEVGVGLLVALENLVPPIPSEIVLAMAGFLAHEGEINVILVWVAATAGSVIGALALYWLGYALGEERLKRWLDHIPLVDTDDLNKADR